MNHLTKIFGFWSLVADYLFPVPCALLLVSCSGEHKADSNIFYYNEQTGIASLDPAFAKNQSIMWAVHQLYNTLVETDNGLNIVPSLAYRWDVSPDRTI